MTSFEMFVIFSPLIALSIGYAIMFGVYSYGCFRKFW